MVEKSGRGKGTTAEHGMQPRFRGLPEATGSAGGGPLGQRCQHNTKMAHPMHNKQDEPAEPKPAKDPVGQARSYEDIRSRIGKGTKKLPK